MIRYALACEAGHAFESWFRSSEDYDSQARRGFVACPHCGSARVEKQIMAPAVRVREEPQARRPVALAEPRDAAMRQMFRAYRRFIEENAEAVGDKFAEEARKIHYGETEERAIYGEASAAEVKELTEEGIEIAPLPILPDERN
ncbi:MAG: DUF1178 family protein [Methylobacterium sp.]|nr:DUF1178 family protein [Methylobacterium sp.]MCA3606276.1 DUF1178 family protein [Methylobacterium sp.]MCA3609725.1 DUF1178 family protein [Methylobacterium sp.]MCA3618853.1 DUF1178 family protein [Methylobacterium sp.]MCA3622176.1 DUF1178 family protein [Methylobacterium sp.]